MPNVAPLRFTQTLHIRCDEEWLQKLDDVCVSERADGRGRVPTRAEIIRQAIEEWWRVKAGAKRK